MGPLEGFKIIEIAGIGPGQFAGMLLADMGASVVRIERPVQGEAVFEARTRDEWCEILEGTETCCTPILDMSEVTSHPHIEARKTFVSIDGITQPAPAPRFSRTESEISSAAGPARSDLYQVLKDWGASTDILAKLSKENQQ